MPDPCDGKLPSQHFPWMEWPTSTLLGFYPPGYWYLKLGTGYPTMVKMLHYDMAWDWGSGYKNLFTGCIHQLLASWTGFSHIQSASFDEDTMTKWIFTRWFAWPCILGVTYTVFIQIDAHALIDAHPPAPSSSWHTKIGEIDDFCIKMHGFEVKFQAHHYAPTSCCSMCYY